jgi:hypothetical protein
MYVRATGRSGQHLGRERSEQEDQRCRCRCRRCCRSTREE